MDFGFINSILRAEYFPPKDLWMTPLSINYYYFGHLTSAVMIKLSGIDPVVGYNLILATIFGLCLAGSFSIGANLYAFFSKRVSKATVFAGLISAFLVTLGGNLHTIYIFFQTYTPDSPVPFWQLPASLNPAGYWYPNATRFIPFTIHEFPSYSFVVADLHGHVLNIPFVLLTLAVLIKIFHQFHLEKSRQLIKNGLHLADFLLLGLLVATSLMANVLDGPIYLLIIFLVVLSLQLNNLRFLPAIINSFKVTLIIAFLAIIFSLPFWLAFKPFASGIGVLCAPQFLVDRGYIGPFLFEVNHCARSPLWMLAILWGFPYFLLAGFIIFVAKLLKSPRSLKLLNPADFLILVLTLGATILIIIPEIFYAKDIYPAHYRANTVFKFGYQAFIIFGLLGGYIITRLLSLRKIPYYLILTPLFLLVAIYPYFAINSYYGITSNSIKPPQSLNGINYLFQLYPTDYQAIMWLRDNIKGQPVILEAQGDSYTDYARVSANTGLPTVIGWPVHEWLWRGSYDEAGKRSTDVATLYQTSDLNVAKELIAKYNISYVFVGTLERQKYPTLNEEKFQILGQQILQSGNTRVYKLY